MTVEEKISPTTPDNVIWNTVKAFKNNISPSKLSNNNVEIIENSKKFIKDHCPPIVIFSSHNIPSFDLNDPPDPIATSLDEPFSLHELKIALKAMNSYSSPGLDQVDYLMLKNTPSSYQRILLECINHFFEKGQTHDSWKNFLITLIPKNSNNKFRPISLASCVLKLTERLINTRLNHFLEQNKLIPDTQNGFRKNKSCQHALAALITDIHLA